MKKINGFICKHEHQKYQIMTDGSSIKIHKERNNITENIFGKSDTIDNFLNVLINAAIEHRDNAWKSNANADLMRASISSLKKIFENNS